MARWSLHPAIPTQAQVVLLPTAFGIHTQGPSAILRAGAEINGFEPLLETDVDDLAIGQISPVVDEPPFGMCERVVSQRLKRQQWPVLLPSVMSASWGGIRAAWKQYPDLAVVHLGAHAQMLPSSEQIQAEEDPGFSSAAWIEQVVRYQIPVVHVGLRSTTQPGWKWLREENHPVFWAAQDWEPADVMEAVPQQPIFLALDVSVLDPALVPTVPYPEPGGVAWPLLLKTCRALFNSRMVVGVSLGGLSVTSGTRQAARPVARILNWLLACYSLSR